MRLGTRGRDHGGSWWDLELHPTSAVGETRGSWPKKAYKLPLKICIWMASGPWKLDKSTFVSQFSEWKYLNKYSKLEVMENSLVFNRYCKKLYICDICKWWVLHCHASFRLSCWEFQTLVLVVYPPGSVDKTSQIAQLEYNRYWYIVLIHVHLSNEKNHGWLGYIGHYTPQLYRHYDTPL